MTDVTRELLAAGDSVLVLTSRFSPLPRAICSGESVTRMSLSGRSVERFSRSLRETGHPCHRSVVAATAKHACREPHIPPTCQNSPPFSTPSRSITESGRALLEEKCRLSTAGIPARVIDAKVQANLLDSRDDDPADVASGREELPSQGVRSNRPVPLFSYPGSPDYFKRWGPPDDRAWDRAHQHYLKSFHEFSELQTSLEHLKCM